jgi:hypothetical protein
LFVTLLKGMKKLNVMRNIVYILLILPFTISACYKEKNPPEIDLFRICIGKLIAQCVKLSKSISDIISKLNRKCLL